MGNGGGELRRFVNANQSQSLPRCYVRQFLLEFNHYWHVSVPRGHVYGSIDATATYVDVKRSSVELKAANGYFIDESRHPWSPETHL